MAKFQLCMFQRTKQLAPMKADQVWERGIAWVEEFNTPCLGTHKIIDEYGNQVKTYYRVRLLTHHAYAVIDTNTQASIL